MRPLTVQTVTRASFFTRLDFRSKLWLMAVLTTLAFLWEDPLLSGLLTLSVLAACLIAGVQRAYLRLIFIALLPFAAFMLLLQGFFGEALLTTRTGQTAFTSLLSFPSTWPLLGRLTLTAEGLRYGLVIVCKTLTMTLVVPLGIFTTDVNAMIVSLVKLGIPYPLAFVFSSTLRFFPLLLQEAQSIIEAQQLRGLELSRLPPLKRARVYATIAVPLILGALAKSQMLEIVLQAKAFGSAERTYLHDSELRRADYLLLIGCTGLLIAALVGYFAWGIGRLGGI
ncbi:MAG TPA: energy-coupling factor transporter transmembrane protein EcfT [Chloroflexi bacterium]|nr:energy-coupling factor transporter transmembrane protein EcfT [Chloroflexota bacterium]